MLSLDDRKVTPLLQTTFGEQNPDVSPDGERFLMIKNAAADVTTSLVPSFVFVLNWFDELKRLVPVR